EVLGHLGQRLERRRVSNRWFEERSSVLDRDKRQVVDESEAYLASCRLMDREDALHEDRRQDVARLDRIGGGDLERRFERDGFARDPGSGPRATPGSGFWFAAVAPRCGRERSC